MQRFILATTLGANYGIYGPAYELGENTPVKPGSEEYLNSEKYQIRHWDRTAPHSIAPLITQLNHIRRENPALQSNDSLHFHPADNPNILCYSKTHGDNRILVAVNLDPTRNKPAGSTSTSSSSASPTTRTSKSKTSSPEATTNGMTAPTT